MWPRTALIMPMTASNAMCCVFPTMSKDATWWWACAGDMGLRGLSGGALANSAAAEAMTSILIYMNKTYGADGAGIRFTGLVSAPPIP